MAALDHPNYFRWDCTFLSDMKKLPTAVFEAFCKGYFTVKKISRVFSATEIDQAHKQNNKDLKTEIGIFDNERGLLERALAGPHISDMTFKLSNRNSTTHHEDFDLFEKKIRLKRSLLVEAFQKFDISFIVFPSGLINIASKRIMS